MYNKSYWFFFKNRKPRGESSTQDIIYVGGGNTKSMLGVWKEWNLDNFSKCLWKRNCNEWSKCWSYCWFDKGITDSFAKELSIIDCLGIIRDIACPHFDEEKEREPYVNDVINKEIIKECICIEGGCALHIKNDFEYYSVDFEDGKRCFRVFKENNKFKKEILLN